MNPHWSERREGGGRFALWLIRSIGLRMGRPAARLLLYPITLYFFFRRGPERRASRSFLSHALGRPAGSLAIMRHMHAYASTVLDRLFLLAKTTRRFDVRVHGLEQLDAQIARTRGALLLGAHIGSFEVLRELADERPDVRVRVIMDRMQTPALTAILDEINPSVAKDVIDAGGDATTLALAVHEAAQQGNLIGLLADRARAREPTTKVNFFGRPAQFPIGPYLLASTLQLPVVLAFGLYRGGKRYDLYFETFAENIRIPRAERAKHVGEWTQRFADRLEHYTRLDPYNWFNFYDFWHRPADNAAVVGEPVTNRG